MFKKVLIAEDFDSINIAVKQTLESLGVEEIQYAKYCDDALLKFKKAKQDNKPFDLLISDLSFVADYRKVEIPSGEKLIEAIKKTVENDEPTTCVLEVNCLNEQQIEIGKYAFEWSFKKRN